MTVRVCKCCVHWLRKQPEARPHKAHAVLLGAGNQGFCVNRLEARDMSEEPCEGFEPETQRSPK